MRLNIPGCLRKVDNKWQQCLPVVDMHYMTFFFFFNDTATTEIYTLSLHDALPISKEIVETLFSPRYPQARSVIASTAAGFVDLSAKLAYDEAKAKQLLDEAGWTLGANGLRQKDGRDFVLSTYESLPQPQDRKSTRLVAQQWARIGVKLNVLSGDAGSRAVDTLDPDKTGVLPGMVGRADPDVIKSNYYPTNRNVLLQKGGVSQKVKSF